MIKRPLFVAGIGVILILCILSAVGFPVFGEPAELNEVTRCIDSEETVKITGLIDRRFQKSNSIQYYLKDVKLMKNHNQNASEQKNTSNQNNNKAYNQNILKAINQKLSDPKNQRVKNQKESKQNNQRVSNQNNLETSSNQEESIHDSGLTQLSQIISSRNNSNNIIEKIPIRQNIIITTSITGQEKCAPIGSEVLVEGVLERIEPPGNPGQFDAASYYATKGIRYTMWAENMDILTEGEGWKEGVQKQRENMAEILTLMLPKKHAGVLAEMLLGEKGYGEPDTRVNYQVGGVLHILSISGLHLSLLGMGCYRLLCRIRMPVKAGAVAAGILMSFYSWFTGSNVATIRALMMFYTTLGAKVSGRSYDSISAISLSLIWLLLDYPGYLLYSGFQLSYVAVIGAGIIYPVWRDILPEKQQIRNRWQKQKRVFKDGILSCIIITLTTLPLTCYYFYEIPLLGLIPNLLILPTMNWVMIPGGVGMGAGVLNLWAGKLILLPVWGILEVYEWVMVMIRKIPWSVYITGQPSLWQILLYYIILLSLTMLASLCHLRKLEKQVEHSGKEKKTGVSIIQNKRDKLIWKVSIPIIGAAVILLLWRLPVEMSVTILDVGQGDSIVLRSAGHYYLVDGGSSSEKQAGAYRILPYLKSQGIQKLDGIIVTHPDEDHVNGIMELLEMVEKKETALRIQRLFLPLWLKGKEEETRFLESAERAGVSVHYLQKGDCIQTGKLQMQVLHPGEKDYIGEENAGSVTLGIHYQGFDALLTGDLEGQGEEDVLQGLTEYDYLKVAHHGSKNSTSTEFLERTGPRIAVISCGKKNYYGHPHRELLERLDERGIDRFITSNCGAITIWRERGNTYVETYRNPSPSV